MRHIVIFVYCALAFFVLFSFFFLCKCAFVYHWYDTYNNKQINKSHYWNVADIPTALLLATKNISRIKNKRLLSYVIRGFILDPLFSPELCKKTKQMWSTFLNTAYQK